MSIYRGPGGGGDATVDTELNTFITLTQQAQTAAQAADASADAAAISESNAAASALAAGISASSASSSANAAAASYDSFDDRYLGPKASAPTVDNDEDPLLEGALYWDTVEKTMYVYSGTAWIILTGGSITTQNFTGDGVTDEFTLAFAPLSENNTQVYIDGVYQQKNTYTVVGNILTFSEAPTAPAVGSDNIEVIQISTLSLGSTTSDLVQYLPAGTGAVATNVQSRLREYEADGGSDLIGFLPSGAGATERAVGDKLREFVSVKDFGASSSASAAVNLAAFKSAVAAVATGGKLVIPVDASFYSIDTSGGLSTAIEINKRMEVVFEGDVKATFGTMQANPPYIFNVTADGVTFSGNGKLIGNGTIDDTNAGDEDSFPGLVYVQGDNFTMRGVVVDTPPKVGVLLRGCSNAKILGNTFEGGPSAYTPGNTAYFSVRSTGGGGHEIIGNHFLPDSGNGRTINAIFFGGIAGGSNNCTIAYNIAKAPHEKITYLYGDYNTVIGNYIDDAPNTDAYRHHGSYNKLIGNTAKNCIGACQIFDGVGNEISNNTFTGLTQAGIIVQRISGSYTGGFNNTKIVGNTVIGGTGTKTDGIRVSVDGASSSGIVVTDNIVSSMTNVNGEGLVRIIAQSPFSIEDALVANNRLVAGTNGVLLDRVIRSLVSDNLISGCTNFPIVETDGAYNKFADNKGRNLSNIGISGLSSASYGTGNQWTDANLTGILTCSAAIITTVTHGGVAANAKVFLQTANDTAGVMIVAKGWPTTSISGANFAVTMANGTAAAGTEQFFYNIVQ